MPASASVGMLFVAAMTAAFTAPSISSASMLSRSSFVRMEEEAPEAVPEAVPTMAPSFTLETEGPLNERFAKDYAQMGMMGAYMSMYGCVS